MKTFKGAFALLILTGLLLVLSLNLFAHSASARADFATWANRSTRVCEPAGYNTGGTSCCQACSWKGVRGIGNVGIGNGNISLMQPGFINDAMKAFNESLAANESSSSETAGNANPANTTGGNVTNGNVTVAPQINGTGNGTLVSRDVATGTCPTCEQAAAAEEELTEPLTPSLLLAGGIIPRGTTYGITLGRPMPHILNENPVEFGALYAKMYGLPMPNGDVIDLGIKSIGYEY
jgi:hypothetical protein